MAIKGLLERFKKGLAKTAQLFNVRAWFGRKVDQSFLDDLEARLIQADVGVAATARLIDRVREALRRQDGRRGPCGTSSRTSSRACSKTPAPECWPSPPRSRAST